MQINKLNSLPKPDSDKQLHKLLFQKHSVSHQVVHHVLVHNWPNMYIKDECTE